jgi:hypothetical protein
MKRVYPSLLAVGVSFCLLATSSIAVESKKTDSYRDRLAKQAESYNADGEKLETQEVQKYPQATRVPTIQAGTPGLVKLRNQMIMAFKKDEDEDAKIAADKLEMEAKANANDRATAIQLKLLLVTKKDNNNNAAAIPLLEDAIATEGLSNNDHYDMLQQLAQRYLIDQDYQNALDKADKFINETKTETKEILLVKGNSLYRLKKQKESVPVLEKAHAMDLAYAPATEMLARAYAETGQLEKAAALTKTLAQTGGNDRAAKINLAITYRDAKQYEQAADIIADLRQSKQLLEERDYLTAINIYSAMKKKENDMVEVVQEGLDKGILQPTASNYNILAEAYYYSGRDDAANKAIANWQKAAPISKNGAIYLNLSIVQCQEERWADCKESAKNAIAKGGINANDAKSQINKADQELAKSR